MTFHLFGQIPSGKNQVLTTRKGRKYPNRRFKVWREHALSQLVQQGLHKKHFTVPLFILVHYWPGDKCIRDMPCMVDALWHVLQRVGFVEDDSQFKHVEWIEEEMDRENPRVLCKVRMRERSTDPLYFRHSDQDEESGG